MMSITAIDQSRPLRCHATAASASTANPSIANHSAKPRPQIRHPVLRSHIIRALSDIDPGLRSDGWIDLWLGAHRPLGLRVERHLALLYRWSMIPRVEPEGMLIHFSGSRSK